MSKALTVHNAEIKTAAVEIRTLTISGKQVTLAVFRQLREERLIAEDGTLNGVPWGTVNYHPDKCADERSHVHVVWQKGVELRRSRIMQPRWWRERFYSEESDDLIQAEFCRNGHRLPDWAENAQQFEGARAYPVVHFRMGGLQCETAVRPSWHSSNEDCVRDASEVRELFQRDLAAEKERRARYDAQWEALNDLPQLFIAV